MRVILVSCYIVSPGINYSLKFPVLRDTKSLFILHWDTKGYVCNIIGKIIILRICEEEIKLSQLNDGKHLPEVCS